MAKKISKQFLLLSSINIVSSAIMAGGDFKDTLALLAVLVVLVFNHAVLLRLVSELTKSMTLEGADARQATKKMVFLLFLKMGLLLGAAAAIYFYKKELTLKVLLLMIFQLIFQVISIKNNQ